MELLKSAESQHVKYISWIQWLKNLRPEQRITGLYICLVSFILRVMSLRVFFFFALAGVVTAAQPVSFRHEVVPLLTRQGCNSGTCHGSPSGKGGFVLSLLAFDVPADHLSMTHDLAGRRVDVFDPDLSLILRKPSNALSHRGGLKLPKSGRAYGIIRRWIAEGCQMDPADTPACTGIELQPKDVSVLRWPRPTAQLRVKASFADGTTRDISHLVQYTISDEAIAEVTPDGRLTGRKRGQAAVMVRYLEHVVARAFTFVKPVPGFKWSNPLVANFIDEKVHAKLRELQYLPSGLCSDSEFVRRVHLDVIGRLPTIDETKAFLSDKKPDKRPRLIDSLLERPEFAPFWAQKWGDLLRLTPSAVTAGGVHKLNRWLVHSLRDNKPYDAFARELLTASGSTYANPPANYYRTAADMNDALETTTQIFLGSRLACAKCHNHPFERWTQDDYYGLGAVFQRVQRQAGARPGEMFITMARSGEVRHPRTGRVMKPWLPGEGVMDVPPGDDPRRVFAKWLTQRDNPWFAKVEANRLWAAVMGRGLVEPIDDFRDSNPPVNSPLLEALGAEFAKSGFNRRHLLRLILNSNTYQSSSQPNAFNADDELLFSHYRPHLLTAEQLLDSVCQVTGVPENFAGLPPGTRATALPTPQLNNAFLKVFGQPTRSSACACERPQEPRLGQALELLNGKFLHGRLEHPANRIQKMAAEGKSDDEIITKLYLSALARAPSTGELAAARKHLSGASSRKSAVADLCWIVLNLNEFLFQH